MRTDAGRNRHRCSQGPFVLVLAQTLSVYVHQVSTYVYVYMYARTYVHVCIRFGAHVCAVLYCDGMRLDEGWRRGGYLARDSIVLFRQTGEMLRKNSCLDCRAVTLDLHLLERYGTVLVSLGVLLEHGHVAQGCAALQALETGVVLVVGEVALGERRSAVLLRRFRGVFEAFSRRGVGS